MPSLPHLDYKFFKRQSIHAFYFITAFTVSNTGHYGLWINVLIEWISHGFSGFVVISVLWFSHTLQILVFPPIYYFFWSHPSCFWHVSALNFTLSSLFLIAFIWLLSLHNMTSPLLSLKPFLFPTFNCSNFQNSEELKE